VRHGEPSKLMHQLGFYTDEEWKKIDESINNKQREGMNDLSEEEFKRIKELIYKRD
jgi:hypothetical protein